MNWRFYIRNPQFFVCEIGRYLVEIDLQEWALPISVLYRPRAVFILRVLCLQLIVYRVPRH